MLLLMYYCVLSHVDNELAVDLWYLESESVRISVNKISKREDDGIAGIYEPFVDSCMYGGGRVWIMWGFDNIGRLWGFGDRG